MLGLQRRCRRLPTLRTEEREEIVMPPKPPKAPVEAPTVSVAARLKPFGLVAAKLSLTNDLEVPANQTVVLDASDQKLSKQLSRLTPKTIDDVKAWIGVPDAAVARPYAPVARPMTVLAVHDTYPPEQSAAFHGVARDYIFGHSASVPPAQLPALNAWLTSAAGLLNMILFQDIHVAAGAKLVINPSIAILFARYITIDHGGVIQIRCTHGAIHCAGIKGAPTLISPVPVGVFR